MGKVKQGTTCSVEGCDNNAIRSFSKDKVIQALQKAGVNLTESRNRRAYLCQEHYKLLKKQHRQEKKIDKWRYSG
jgi:hypothetical protein